MLHSKYNSQPCWDDCYCPDKCKRSWYFLLPLSHAALCCLRQARCWVQVMRGLREEVKLKKVQERQYNPLPIEYQLTPYEMLMDDIRSKRYKLRKVMVGVQLGPHIDMNATCMPYIITVDWNDALLDISAWHSFGDMKNIQTVYFDTSEAAVFHRRSADRY